MSKQPENTFISAVHRHLPPELYRIKNHNAYNSGQPDCWYSGNAADLWVEYKFIAIPKRDNTVIVPELSALQQEWLASRHAEGRQVGVIVGSKDGGVWFPGIAWRDYLQAGHFRSALASRKTLAVTIRDLVS